MKSKILDLFRSAQDIVSGETLSTALGISRVSVWKHIQKLQECGYEIEATPRGYQLLKSPDTPFPWEFPQREGLIHYFPEVSSTMDIAREMARKGHPHFSVVIAGRQTSGRGRLRRTWYSKRWRTLFHPDSSARHSAAMVFSGQFCGISGALPDAPESDRAECRRQMAE